jgi:hypothetical protein
MKTAKLFLIILITIACQSCSSDSDIDPEQTIDNENGIHYKGVFYPLNTAIIKKTAFNVWNRGPSVYIRLFNADPLFNADDPFITHPKWLDINKFSFFYEATEATVSTITPVPHYNMRINSDYDASNIHLATTILRYHTLLPENIAVSSAVHINAISADEIELDFEFTRPDGEIITGRYKGTYSDVSTED